MKVLIGSDDEPTKRLSFRWIWEPRDIWVGVFWSLTRRPIDYARYKYQPPKYLLIYIAVIPCLPVCIAWRTRR